MNVGVHFLELIRQILIANINLWPIRQIFAHQNF